VHKGSNSVAQVEQKPIVHRSEVYKNRFTGRLIYEIKTEKYMYIGTQREISAEYSPSIRRKILESSSISKDFNDLIKELKQEKREYSKPFFKIGGKPAIPGSTLKGACRSNIELRFVKKNERGRFLTCLINAKSAQESHKHIKHRNYFGFESTELIPRRRSCGRVDTRRDPKLERNNTCLSCQLFGKMGLRGLIQFSPAYLVAKQSFNEQFEELSSKFGGKIEVAKEGTSFAAELTFRNLTIAELGY